jgi:hypothetical protein
MSRKIELLYEKIFHNFITGVYGVPKVPNEREVMQLIASITDDNSDPITKRVMLEDIYIDEIHDNFETIVDDLDVLYSSIEDQSLDILDQLTNSLKEHNGVKRELRNIESRADDISAGKTGEDYIEYTVTENFNSLDNVNVAKTTTDPDTKAPIVDIQSGRIYIPNSLMELIDLTHYFGRKLDISNTDYVGHIVDQGYIGISDAGTILNVTDDRRLVYRVKTDVPSAMKMSFIIQLHPARKSMKTNGIVLVLDPDNTRGYLRIQYKKDTGWEDIPDMPVQDIINDKMVFRFRDIDTTHIKFQFIKETPDLLDSNEYFLSILNLSIFNALSHKTSTFYSKSIKIEPYDKEKPVIGNIAVNVNGFVPDGCSADVYVAQDKRIRGYFTDVNGAYVRPDSIHVSQLMEDITGDYVDRHILLSDIQNHPDISGISNYSTLEHDWMIVQSFNDSNNMKPAVVDFLGAKTNDPFDNSVFQTAQYLFGDTRYKIDEGTVYPQQTFPTTLDHWFLSGIITTENAYYPYMVEYIASGLLQSGWWVDYDDPTGYPFNYYRNDLDKTLRFNDYHMAINGWWRPESDLLHPSGFDFDTFPVADPIPDFYFNGNRYYKVFKFEQNAEVIQSTVKLYTYQTRPIVGGDDDYYPHNMTWKYNTKDIINTVEIDTTKNNPFTGNSLQHIPAIGRSISPPPGTGMFELPIPSGSQLVENSVRDVSYVNHNNILQKDTHFNVHLIGETAPLWYLDMSPGSSATSYLASAHVYAKYSVKSQDLYTSYWDGFILATSDSTVKVKQYREFYDVGRRIVKKILVEDLDGKKVNEFSPGDENITIPIKKGIFRLKVFCLVDLATKYPVQEWSPYSKNFIETGAEVKIVPRVDPVRLVDFDILLNSTPYENDSRASVIATGDGFKYVVVKEPSKNLVPGYFYDASKSAYVSKEVNLIRNIGHYKRQHLRYPGVSGYWIEEFITGSLGGTVQSGTYLDTDSYLQDISWNNGNTFPAGFDNLIQDSIYPQHYTFGSRINVEDTVANKGHLFYNTSENLPAFYTIRYGVVDRNDPTVDRFLYKIQLNSEHERNTPILEAVKFSINVEEGEVTK